MPYSMTALDDEMARAVERVSGALDRLERALATSKGRKNETEPDDVNLLRQEAQSLREVHRDVAGKLGHAIERLRHLVGEEASG